jgi:hypothetical protein
MAELTDAVCGAHAVVGPEISALEHELGDTLGLADAITFVKSGNRSPVTSS